LGDLIQGYYGWISATSLKVRDVLLREAGFFRELLLSHASGLPHRPHIAANQLSHVHRQLIGDVCETILSPLVCIRSDG
jgi:hypothetical protein